MNGIFGPFLAMALLTLIVWSYMYLRRIRYMMTERVHPQSVATPDKVASIIPEVINNPAHNLKNLFELPVLFYAMCLYLHVTSSVDSIFVIAAWIFVLFRIMHSFVQCTSNVVMTRFRLYMLASIALWFIVLRAIVQVVL